MKPQEQLRKERNGDCLRACVATLLEVNIEKVPDFALIEGVDSNGYPEFWIALQSWLNARGLWFLEMQLPPNVPFMPLPYDCLCILFGETVNGVRHSIVGKIEGSEFIPVFNPWPEAEFANGVGALGFIIPRDPSYYINMGRALDKIGSLTKNSTFIIPKEIHRVAQEALHQDQQTIFKPNGDRP